jgi:hypothetical protein
VGEQCCGPTTPLWATNNNNDDEKKRKQKSSNNRNCGSTSSKLYICPNRLCNLTMTSQQGWTNHYLHYSDCFKAASGSTVFWAQRAAETQVDHKQAFVETDSEDEDNILDTQPDDGSEINLNIARRLRGHRTAWIIHEHPRRGHATRRQPHSERLR